MSARPTTKAEFLLKDALRGHRRVSDLRAMGDYQYRNPADFLLREGRFMKPRARPFGVPSGPPRLCFNNAIMFAMVNGLPYVEGYGIHQVGVPIHHAWNLDATGNVIDVTWSEEIAPIESRAYLGVVFAVKRADEATWDGDAAILDDYARGWPVLRERWAPEESPGPVDGLWEELAERYAQEGRGPRVSARQIEARMRLLFEVTTS